MSENEKTITENVSALAMSLVWLWVWGGLVILALTGDCPF